MEVQKKIMLAVLTAFGISLLYLMSKLEWLPTGAHYAISALVWFMFTAIPLLFVSYYAVQTWKTRRVEMLLLFIVWAAITMIAVPRYAAKTYFFARATYYLI